MAEARETSTWAQTLAIIGRISNLFADRDQRVDLMQFIPHHLRPTPEVEREPTPEEIKLNFAALRLAFQSGAVRQGA